MKKIIPLFLLIILIGLVSFWFFQKEKVSEEKKKASQFGLMLDQKTATQGSELKPTPQPTLTPVPTIDVAKYGPCRNVPVLMYHHINSLTGEQKTSSSLTVATQTFQEQMDYLVKKGYQTITPRQLYDDLNGGSLPAKPILITFDDGYVDNFNEAFPILKNHGFKFTIFLPTGLINSGPNYLNWNQLKEMKDSGFLNVGAHTWSHKALVNLSPEKLKTEISLSKTQIEDFYGGPVEAFAYPYGSDNKTVEAELRNESFLMAFLTTRGAQCAKLPFEFHRIRIGNASLTAYGF